MYRVGVAEEVVHVAQNLLIRPDEEHTYIIMFAREDGVQGDVVRLLSAVDVGRYLAVAVAGDVLQGGAASGLFLQPGDRHDGEELVDAPRVGHRLEEREVAEVLVGHLLVELAQLVGDMLLVVCQLGHFMADGPVERLNLRTCLEVDDAVAEEVERLLANVLGIVPVLEKRARREVVPYLRQVMHEFVVLGPRHEVLWHLRRRDAFQHIDDKDAVVCGERASALRDDVGMRDVVLVGCLHEGIDAVVDILLDAVVDAALAVAASGTVVIHTQTAAAIHKLDVEAHRVELHIVLCCLAEGGADAANFVYLASDVEVDEAQAVAQPQLVKHLQGHQQLGAVEPELRGIAAALAPLAAAVAGQLDADAEVGMHAQLLGCLGYDGQFGKLLDDKEDSLAHLLSQESQLDEVLVLVAVADDEAVAVHVCGNHGMQFGFRAGLQPEVVALAVADDFFYDGAHLVHLHGEDDKVFTLVVIFLACLAETFVGLLDAVVQYVGEAEQHGSRHMAGSQVVHQLLEVHLHAVLFRRDIDMSLLVDAKVIDSPTLDVVELLRILYAPLFHFSL